MVRSLIALSLAAAMVLVVSVAGASGEVSQSEIDELVSGLLQSNFQIIMKASDALAEIGEPCVPALRRALETANDKWGRINIISVLKRIPGEQSISALVYCLDDIDGTVQENAVKATIALVSQAPDVGAPLLVPLLVDESPAKRKAAREILLAAGWTGADVAKELVELSSSEDAAKRDLALEQLKQLGLEAKSSIPHLIDQLNAPGLDMKSRVALLEVIVSIGGAEAEEVGEELARLLIEGDEYEMQQAVVMLLQAGWSVDQIATQLVEAACAGDEDRTGKAMQALVYLSRRKPAAIRYLVDLVKNEDVDRYARAAAYKSLDQLTYYLEDIDRAPVAVAVDDGVYIGWRLLATDPSDVSFDIYRDGVKVNFEPIVSSTNFLDHEGDIGSIYKICALSGGQEWEWSKEFTVWDKPYLSIPLQKPPGGFVPDGSYTYSANDASVGDLDGDGEYEVVLKWEPSNAHDNAHDGYTGEVLLDAYKLDGTHMWRINLGRNVRAGAHYTQFMVYDLDGDGKAEVACKTADGTVDGLGQVIGDPDADYRNSRGRILDGPEYLTVFDGETGAALDTVDYEPPRGRVIDWGDDYGNRCDRFLACIAYLDGKTPSLVMCRGYYTRTVLVAYNFRDGRLHKLWTFDSRTPGNSIYEGQGNHNLSVADVDFDGKDEIIYGACAIDHDGTGLYSTGLGHGDAMHVGNLDPVRPGLEVFQVHEPRPNPAGIEFRDAATGDLIWGIPTNYDVGRGLCADIDPNYPGEEMWAAGSPLYNCKGEVISQGAPSSINFAIWWDGDLLRELLDGNRIDKWDYQRKRMVNLLTATGCTSNNGTKATPCLQADLFGDWREEVMWKTADSTELRIYTTTDLTEYRIPTLMHDRVYRLGIAWQNVAYNQPPHTSFYLGHGMEMPELVLRDVYEALDKYADLADE